MMPVRVRMRKPGQEQRARLKCPVHSDLYVCASFRDKLGLEFLFYQYLEHE